MNLKWPFNIVHNYKPGSHNGYRVSLTSVLVLNTNTDMSDIKLVSEEYTSKFVTGPALDQKLTKKQDKLQCYNESNNEVDIASNKVTLQSRVDTVGIKLDLNSTIDITVGSERNWRNILSTDIMDNVFLGDQTTGIYCDGTLYDKNGNEIHGGGSGSSFNYISESDDLHSSLSLGQGPNGTVQSIFVCGPLYGSESSIFVAGPIVLCEDEYQYKKTIISDTYGNGAVGGLDGFAVRHCCNGGQQFKIGMAADGMWTDAVLELESYDYNGTKTGYCDLDGDSLNKLSSLINNADAILALLNS